MQTRPACSARALAVTGYLPLPQSGGIAAVPGVEQAQLADGTSLDMGGVAWGLWRSAVLAMTLTNGGRVAVVFATLTVTWVSVLYLHDSQMNTGVF